MAFVPCAWTRARLGLFVGDDLIGPERREVERHVIACAKCRTQLRKHEESLAVLRDAAVAGPDLSAAISVWPGLERQIRESRHSAPISWAWPRSVLALAATIAVASLAVLAPRPQFDLKRTATDDVVNINQPTIEVRTPSGPRVVAVSRTEASPRIVDRKIKLRGKSPKPKTDSLVAKTRAKDESDRSSSPRTEVEAMASDRDTH